MTTRPTSPHPGPPRLEAGVGGPDPSVPTVTVVIPTYNRARLLRRALDSVLAQTWQDFEVLVVDDGSTDQTVELVAGYRNPRIRVFSLGDRFGAPRARNVGIRMARAEWVALLDSDDEWLPGKLEVQLARVAHEDSRDAVVYCFRQIQDHLMDRTWPRRTRLYEGDVLEALVRRRWMPTTSAVMARRAALLAVGGFDEALPSCQDYDLWLQLAHQGYRFVGVDACLVVKHQHPEPQITADSVARARGLQVLDAKWRDVISERFGPSAYRKWRRYHLEALPYARLMQVRAAVANGDRAAAWRLCRTPWSGPWILRWRFRARALAIMLLGRQAYGLLVRARAALGRSTAPAGKPPAPAADASPGPTS